jgi:diguanylate cyclase (GGDEF)-like protein
MTALALALLAVAGRMTQIDRSLPAWHRAAGLIAFLFLLTYLIAGYLRQRPPPAGWLLVGIALVVAGSALPDLAFAAVLCVVITVFQGLYGTVASTVRHTIVAIVALPLVILFDRTLGAAQLGSVPWLILMGVTLSLITVAVVVRSLFDLLERQIRAARRDAIIARTGTELIDETDMSAVDHAIQEATRELCQLAPGVGILTLRRTGNLMVVADQVGFPESVESAALPLPGPPATTEPATILEPVGVSTLTGGSGQYEPGFHDLVNGLPEPTFEWPMSFTNRLNTLIGESRQWRPVELPANNGSGLVVVSGLQKVPDDTVEGFRSLANLRALAQARSSSHLELVHLAHHDQLTGLPNRTCFLDALARARADGSLAAVLILDLDNFRRINDTHGHDAGDKALIAVAEELRKCVGDQGIMARLAGDEFGIGVDHATNAERLAERIGHRLRDPAVLRHPTGACVGIASADPALEPADLLRRADSAVQAAKDAGKGQIVHFVPGRHGNLTELRMIEQHLPHAASRGEILVYYQPNVDLLTRRCVGVEALARWSHPTLGMVSLAGSSRSRSAPATSRASGHTSCVPPAGRWRSGRCCLAARTCKSP